MARDLATRAARRHSPAAARPECIAFCAAGLARGAGDLSFPRPSHHSRKHEFAVIAVGKPMPLGIRPKVAGAGLIDIRLALLQGNAFSHTALVVVRVLIAAIADLPGLLGIVAGDGGHRPNVTISGNLAAVIEVVQNTELASQLMLVGCDGFPVHAQRRIAIARFQVAKNLVIGTVLFDDIDDVLDGILACLERKGVAVGRGTDCWRALRPLIAASRCSASEMINARDRPSDQGRNVRMLFPRLCVRAIRRVWRHRTRVRSRPLPLA